MPEMDLQAAYRVRFDGMSGFRDRMWQTLCRNYFQRYVPPDSTIAEFGAGYCEFINNIRAREKYAVDLNPDTRGHASGDVTTIISPASDISSLQDASLDIVFMSNFLEHLTRMEITATLGEVRRCLRPGGRVMILQPNIRYLANDYWMFFDHITPVDDRALAELLRTLGFVPLVHKSRFLPFTTKSRFPKSVTLLKVYLASRFLQLLFGKQAFLVWEKPSG